MRNMLLAAAATLALATPAAARDNSMYIELDGGILWASDMSIDGLIDYTDVTFTDATFANLAKVDFKRGYDIAGIAGYDFGMFRVEGELGYKRVKGDHLAVTPAFLTEINAESGLALTQSDFDDIGGSTRVLSGMLNGLVDLGEPTGVNFSIGGGIGRAKVKFFGDSDSAMAYQLLAQVRFPVSESIEAGLKYRYFRTGKLHYRDMLAFTGAGAGFSSGTAYFDVDDHFSSNSLLATLTFNLGATAEALPPPPPPPPPPAAPATQTCPDGSVILATDACPMAPPPPPPAPPPVERGERGQ